MFENETYENILQRMMDELPDDIDKREGSLAFDMLAPKALELAMAYKELDIVVNLGFVDTTYGKFLDSKVLEAGITRDPAQKAKGVVTITIEDTGSFTIPIGTVVYTDSGIRFTIDKEVTIIGPGSADVGITAVLAGKQGNVSAGTIINIEFDNATCNNLLPTQDGLDPQSDESLLNEYLNRVRKPATSGNVYHYYQWATSVPGIGDARVIPIWNGPGTVKVIVISTDKTPVSVEKTQEVYDYIEKERPIGADVTVTTATSKAIDISVTVSLQDTQTTTEVQRLLIESVTKYLKETAFKDSEIKYSIIGSLILDIPGVLDYSNLLINGSVANIPVTNEEVAVIGTVTIS